MFIQALFSFPTVFFTGLVALLTLYWVVTLMGFVDVNLLERMMQSDEALDEDDNSQSESTSPTQPLPTLPWVQKLHLEGVPLTVIISAWAAWAWLFSFLATVLIYPHITEDWVMLSVVVWVLILASAFAAAVAIFLLRRFKAMLNFA